MRKFTSWLKPHAKLATAAAVVVIGGGTVVATTCTCVVPTFPPGGGGGEGAVTAANLYVSSTEGSPSCTRSETLISYSAALAANHVCGTGSDGWEAACEAAADNNTAAGTLIGVKGGDYPVAQLGNSEDCSGGLGADVNPNYVEQGVSTGTTVAWAKYECADGVSTKNVQVGASGAGDSQWINAASHILVFGGCFDLHSVNIGAGGSTTATTDIQIVGGSGCDTDFSSTDCIHMDGLQIQGGRNILIQNVNQGPFMYCGKNAAPVTTPYRCDPGVPFELPFAGLGSSLSASCGIPDLNNAETECGGYWTAGYEPRIQDYFHSSGAGDPLNLRFQNYLIHDNNAVGSGIHTGCWQDDETIGTVPAHNWVFDHIVCERIQTQGAQVSADGVTIQNSVFTCVNLPTNEAGGAWDTCESSGFYAIGVGGCHSGCTMNDLLIRYNDIIYGNGGASNLLVINPSLTTFVNARVVANIFAQAPSDCTLSGVSCDRNAFLNGVTPGGTNTTVLSAGDPFTDSSTASPGNLFSYGSLLNLALDGSPTVPTVNPATSSAFDLATDSTGAARTNPTHYGITN